MTSVRPPVSPEEKRALLVDLLKKKSSARHEATLSFGQKSLLFHQAKVPGHIAYNAMLLATVAHDVDLDILRRAFDAVVERHDVLRTMYTTEAAGSRTEVRPHAPCDFGVTDASSWSATSLDERINAEASRPYDLAADLVMRVRIYTRGSDAAMLMIAAHHIAIDHWSLVVLMDEIRTLYADFFAGRRSSLPPVAAQFSEFAEWQRELVASPEGERQWKYWQSRLRGDLPVLELPMDRPRPANRSLRGDSVAFMLDTRLTERLRALARGQGTTLFAVVLSGFYALLSRYTHQRDIVVGAAMAGRGLTKFEHTIGYFANTVPLRVQCDAQLPFRELVARVAATVLDGADNQHYPFPLLVERLGGQRDPSRSPICDVIVGWEKPYRSERVNTEGISVGSALDFRLVSIRQFGSPQDLILMGFERSSDIEGVFQFNSDLFERDTIARMAIHLTRMLEAAVANPAQSIGTLPFLTNAELDQMLVQWNDTASDYPRESTVHALFDEQARRTPGATAVRGEHGELTYGELNLRANRLAHRLRQRGVEAGGMVGVCMHRSADALVALLGVLKAGAAYVPLDPSYPADRLTLMLEETRPMVVLTETSSRAFVPPGGFDVLCVDIESVDDTTLGSDDALNVVRADGLAYVMYTSGSTGRPKGVCVSHRAVVRLVRNTNFHPFAADEVFLHAAPLSFDASTLEIWGPLLNGGSVAIVQARTPSLDDLASAITRHGVTTAWLTAGLFHLMVDRRPEALDGLQYLFAGGDVLSPMHVAKAVARMSGRVVNGYGPTENTTFTCCHIVTRPPCAGESIPIGRPIANTQVYVLDELLQPVPAGVPGELFAGGDGLARGYLNRPDLTEEKFVPHPFSADPDARLYRTGDQVRYLRDGTIEFLGRLDQQVKIRGFRIELAEIEAALGLHAAVRECAVVVYEPEKGDKRLAAYVVSNATVLDTLELRRFLQERLPEYMVPGTFVQLDELPLSPNGKVDRGKLPPPETRAGSAESPAPSGDLEEQIADVWRQALKVASVGRHDNFFELGGHSLLIVEVHSRLKEVLHVDLAIVDLFRYPTVALLSSHLRAGVNRDPNSGNVHERPRRHKSVIGRRLAASRRGEQPSGQH